MPPEAVAEKGLLAIEDYLTDVRTTTEAGVELSCLKLLKVVLVGSLQAGKTRYDVGPLPILVQCHCQHTDQGRPDIPSCWYSARALLVLPMASSARPNPKKWYG